VQGVRLVSAVVVALAVMASAVAHAPAATKPSKPTSRQPIIVAGEPIPLRALRHWQQLLAASQGEPGRWRQVAYRQAATQLLVEHRWIEGEAKRLGVVVTRQETGDAYKRFRRNGFRSTAEFRRFTRRTKATYRDLVRGVRIDLLGRRITAIVTEGAVDSAGAQFKIMNYRAERQARWLPQTTCYPQWYLEQWCTFA
jgi:hypothetical protein